jgi:hypothetical protein
MSTTVTTARALHLTNPLMTGADVKHVQDLLTNGPFGNFHPGDIDGQYGPATAAAVRAAKFALGFPDANVDGACGPKLLAFLEGTPLPPAFQAMAAARKHDLAKALTVRDSILQAAQWGIDNEAQIHYKQLRPIDGIKDAFKLPLQTDCSGFITLCYAWSGAPDPNGSNFSGAGFTGTLVSNGRPIPKSAVQPGDLVIWGAGTGEHVCMVMTAEADPWLLSHGQEKGPIKIRFSQETKFHKAPVRWFSYLP